jgi:hypothetical protein
VRQKYVAILGLACLLTLVSPELTANAVAQENIKDVDACGLVMGMDGRAIPDATITAKSGENVMATATSLSDGSFSFMQSLNSQIQLEVRAPGFVPASGAIEHMQAHTSMKCGHPIYVVLAVGGGNSYLTTKKRSLPRSK